MHTGPMPESAGTLSTAEAPLYECRKCREKKAQCQTWDSSCGGYTDYKYTCLGCGHIWWVDGIDS